MITTDSLSPTAPERRGTGHDAGDPRAAVAGRFAALITLQILLAHAIAFLGHEYAHSFSAWLMGFKANPLALDYGDRSVANFIALLKVNENVDYVWLFAHGYDHAVALIAFAGIGIGNLLLYWLARFLVGRGRLRAHPRWLMFFFWLCLMNIGNFYDYVPIRAFDTNGDMGHLERGLHISPWLVLVTIGCLTGWTIWDFYNRIIPTTLESIFPGSRFPDARAWRTRMSVVATIILLGFYGGAGLLTTDAISNALSWLSIIALIPAVFLVSRRAT